MSEAVSLKIYYRIFGALMVLTALTVGIAFVDLGAMNTFVAIAIAVCKATLVILFFMHVKYSGRLIWVFAAMGFVWFVIMVVFTMSDYIGRQWMDNLIPLP